VARDVGKLVDLAQAHGWDVWVIASPDGLRFIDAGALAAKTGHSVRSQYRQPSAPDSLPPADAVIAAPLTCNSAAKWAAGISDTFPLGLLVEAVGMGLPVVAVPFSSREHLSFPAVQDAIRKLADWGVIMLAADDIPQPRESHLFPWAKAWRAVLDHSRHTAR
jgi:phosphopantothenoylcysteine synthetase/decarboxylase